MEDIQQSTLLTFRVSVSDLNRPIVLKTMNKSGLNFLIGTFFNGLSEEKGLISISGGSGAVSSNPFA